MEVLNDVAGVALLATAAVTVFIGASRTLAVDRAFLADDLDRTPLPIPARSLLSV